MARLLGFEIKRSSEKSERNLESFTAPITDDGALTMGSAVGGSYGMLYDIEGNAKSEAELVTRYRTMAENSEIRQAIDEIVNEFVNVDSDENVVDVKLDNVDLPDKIKDMIREEFDNILTMMDFSNQAYEIVSRFYVDGRLNYHPIIDKEDLSKGILELRYIDPRKIVLIKEMDEVTDPATGAKVKKVSREYYVFSENGFVSGTDAINGIKIAKDSIIRVTSGLLSTNNALALSHIHKAMRPMNQLRMLEDATVIYTMTRAPERRVFYVDVGSLPKNKAEQYLQDIMARHKNKVVYDPVTGQTKDGRNMMTMTEDYWFARREGSRSTEVDTLQGGGGLGENENLSYFQRKLFKSLNVPLARLEPESMYSIGRSSEITREELRFSKFIRRLRAKFTTLFDKALERQLILKGIITPDEWDEIQNKISYDFNKENYFEELKEAEILRERINTLREVKEYEGVYFSREYIRKYILMQSDDDIKQIDKEIEAEKKSGAYDSDLDDVPGF